jgi:hypothetical protein
LTNPSSPQGNGKANKAGNIKRRFYMNKLKTEDYKHFKEMLKDFIEKANQNAMRLKNNNFSNKGIKYAYSQIERFEIDKKTFSKQYVKSSWACSKNTTYINVGWVNITCIFENNRKIKSLQNQCTIRDDKGKKRDESISDNVVKEMDKLNEKYKECFSIEDLGLDNNELPNEKLMNFLDQLLEMHRQYESYKALYPVKKPI